MARHVIEKENQPEVVLHLEVRNNWLLSDDPCQCFSAFMGVGKPFNHLTHNDPMQYVCIFTLQGWRNGHVS